MVAGGCEMIPTNAKSLPRTAKKCGWRVMFVANTGLQCFGVAAIMFSIALVKYSDDDQCDFVLVCSLL